MNGNISMVGGTTSANVIVTNNGNNYSCAISAGNDVDNTVGNITIKDSHVTAQNLQSTIEGHGIYCSTKFDVVNSIVLAQGLSGAVIFTDNNSTFSNVKTEASNNYDGIDKAEVTLSSSNCSYSYVYISTNNIISVDITWGDMDYTYTEGKWDASNHTYAMGTWTTANANSDKVTIVNNSNVPVNANIVYNEDSGYSSTVIEGKIVDTEGGINVITTSINILASNSFVAYLNLEGRLASGVADKTVIGNVTVTLTE